MGHPASRSSSHPTASHFPPAGGRAIIVFQDPNISTATPQRYLTALDNSGEGFGGQTTTGRSELPPGLTEGVNALALPTDPTENDNEYDNVYYNCALTTGTAAQLSGAINTLSNWTLTNNANNSFTGCGFTCQAACADPVLNALVASPTTSCPGTGVTLSVDGSLNDASRWELRTGSCTGPIVQTTTGNTFPTQVNPSSTTAYFVTVADCGNQQVCRQGAVTRTVSGADAGADIQTSGATAVLDANEPTGGATGQWTIVSGDGNGALTSTVSNDPVFTGTAGQTYLLRWTITGGGCSTTSDEVEVSFLSGSTLAVGDVAFTGLNSGQAQVVDYRIVFLTPVNAGTEVRITDKGWLGDRFRGNENVGVYTTRRNYPCGTEIILLQDFLGGPYRTEDAAGRDAGPYVPVVQFYPSFNNGNDQLFAFQGTEASPSFLAGIDITPDGWDANPEDNFRNSALPAALAGATNAAVAINGAPEDAKYTCSVTEATPSVLRAAINDPDNWNASDAGFNLRNFCGLSCDDCVDPVLTGLVADPDNACPGVPVTITIDGSLNSATAWRLHLGASVADSVIRTTTGNTLTVDPDAPTTYTVSALDCDLNPVSFSVSVNRAAGKARILLDRPVAKTPGTSVALMAEEPSGGQTGSWSLVSGTDDAGAVTGNTLTGTAGQAYVVRYTVSGGTCPTTTDETTASFPADGTLALGGSDVHGL